LNQFATNPVSFGEDENAELYIAGIYDGTIYHMIDLSAPQPPGKFEIGATVSSSLAVYPNPSTGNFNLVFNSEKSEQATVEVFNSMGELMMNEIVVMKQGQNNLSFEMNLSRGIYFITVNSEEKKLHGKFLVE